MTEAKAKISLKLSNQIPDASIEGKRAFINLNCQGQSFLADVNAKTYRKGCQRASEYEQFVISIDGDFNGLSNGVISLSGCGLQVFEKKQRDPKAEGAQAEQQQSAKELEQPPQQSKAAPSPKPQTTDKESRKVQRSELPPNLFNRRRYEKNGKPS